MIVHVACLKSLHQGHNIWITDDFYVLDGGKYTVQTVIVGNISIRILRVKIQSDIKTDSCDSRAVDSVDRFRRDHTKLIFSQYDRFLLLVDVYFLRTLENILKFPSVMHMQFLNNLLMPERWEFG